MKTIKYSEVTAMLGTFIKCCAPYTNCMIVYFEKGCIYCSYEAVVAVLVYSVGWYYTTYHDFSKTTCLHMTRMTHTTAIDRRHDIVAEIATLITDYERP